MDGYCALERALDGRRKSDELAIVTSSQSADEARGSFMAIGAAVLLGALCALVVNTLPVFLTVLGRTLSLDETQVGYVALADMGGIAFGTVICAMLSALFGRFGWRHVAVAGVAVLVFGNLLASQAESYPTLIAARAVAGTGAGISMAIVYAVLATGSHEARNLAIFNVLQLASGAIGIQFLGTIADSGGASRLFLLIAGISVAGFFLCLLLPRTGRTVPDALRSDSGASTDRISGPGWLAIISALLYFAGAGAMFGFLAYMGIAWGGDPASVESSLSTVLVAGMCGGMVSALVGSRWHFRRPLYVGYAILLVSIALLLAIKPVGQFVLLASLFGFGWNILTPFQFAAVTHTDNSSSAAMLVNACTLGGIAIGPAVAGNFVTADYSVVIVGAFVTCIASLVLLLLALRWHELRPKSAPALVPTLQADPR
jgi:predicted MFS family arabinose efflux permease